MLGRAILVLCAVLALAACSKQQAQERAGDTAPPRAASQPPPARTGPAAPAQAAPGQAAQAAKLTHQNEDGSETVEDATGDSGAHNALLAAVAASVMAATPAAAADLSGPVPWQEGVNYTRIVPAQPTAVAPGQVEVLEFFWYACPHCYAIDPLVESWRKTKPGYVSFARVPVTWDEGHRELARLFYTVKSLGKLDQLHTEIFKEIQLNGDPLVARDPSDVAGTERIQAAFAAKHGIPEATFKNEFEHGFSMSNDLRNADELVQRYRIDGVPTFVVNGKYIADVASAGSPEKLIALVGDLAAQEHKH
ncbi:MAG: thiol:disulfide interchange protein DsbA/DsbL [Steroidobacteraceae bacterium]|jgi:thiol:disulfide interchange protein DsbA